jgi:hypothetical protein
MKYGTGATEEGFERHHRTSATLMDGIGLPRIGWGICTRSSTAHANHVVYFYSPTRTLHIVSRVNQ